MLVKVYGSAVFGIEATTIIVEVNIDKGIGYHLAKVKAKEYAIFYDFLHF